MCGRLPKKSQNPESVSRRLPYRTTRKLVEKSWGSPASGSGCNREARGDPRGGQKDEGRLEQLARLNELAQRENEIAQQAENNEQQEGAEAEANPELQQAQEQLEAELKQQLTKIPKPGGSSRNQADAAAELAEQAADLSKGSKALLMQRRHN